MLKDNTQSRVCIGLIVGIFFGASFSLVVRWLFCLFAADESVTSNVVTMLYSVTEWSAYKLHGLTGREWPPGEGHMLAWQPTSLIVVTNSLLCGLVGVFVGRLLRMRKQQNGAVYPPG